MAGFLVAAGALAVTVLVVALGPVWRARRGVALTFGVTVVCSAAALYLLVGTPAALDPEARKAPATPAEAIPRLQARVAGKPNDAQGWRSLGRAYASNQQLTSARDAYVRAAALASDDPDVLVEAAKFVALADPQRRFDTRAVGWLRHALEVQPGHQRARWLLGVSLRQAGQPAEAAAIWEPLLTKVDPRTAAPLRNQINLARQAAGLSTLPTSPSTALVVRVHLDPRLAADLRPNATLFLIARSPGDQAPPVAVERHAVGELPLTTTLDDDDSLMPTAKLSAQREVELVARISQERNVTPKAGDFESAPVRVALPASQPIAIPIDRVRD